MSDEQGRHEPIAIEPQQIEALRTRLQGNVYVPGDAGYDTACQTWDAKTFDQHPAIVVMPTVSSDVVAAVNFAQENSLSIAVQGAGHGHPYPADDALFVNFANMNNVQILAETAIARVEPGATSKDVVQSASPHGLAPLNGFAASVGVVGYLLGGGTGWLTRQYGFGAVSIHSVELVTGDGRVLQVDEHNYPDLFWGLHGGGGNFGIVTSLEFALYPVNEIFGGQVVYPIEQGKDVLNAYLQWVRTVPDGLTSAVRIMHFPSTPDAPPPLRGKSALVVLACYNGEEKTGEALLHPMRSLGKPLLDTFAQIPYSKVATISNDPDNAPPLFAYNESGGFRDFSTNDIETLLNIAGNPDSGIFQTEIRHFGGVLARQPEGAMPCELRHANFYLDAIANAPSPDKLEGGKRSLRTMMQALKPSMTGEILINFVDAGNISFDLTRAAYSSENYQHLVALKDTYDPKNVFRFNHNIPPSS